MENVAYIIVSVLLALGPATGFFLGMKFAAALLGIDLHHGDKLCAVNWDDLPEVYRPQPANGEPVNDAPAADPAAQEGQEDGLQGEGLPIKNGHPEDALDAVASALQSLGRPLAAMRKDPATFAAIMEAAKGGPVELENTETVEITLEPEEHAADEAAAPAAPADGGPV